MNIDEINYVKIDDFDIKQFIDKQALFRVAVNNLDIALEMIAKTILTPSPTIQDTIWMVGCGEIPGVTMLDFINEQRSKLRELELIDRPMGYEVKK